MGSPQRIHTVRVALLALCALLPLPVLAQTPVPAGVVTTLQGEATLLSAARPQASQPLRFRDELFYRDRINTKERSIVRLLLGGKAVVTVRQLSTLTITEEPGTRATIDLFGGKIGVGVARSRMKPGESLEIRTPNAIAAVRGTYIISEVSSTGAGPPVSVFTLLEGSADILTLDRTKSVSLQPLQSVSVTGNTIGQVVTVPAGVQTQVLADLQPATQHALTPVSFQQALTAKEMEKAPREATPGPGPPTATGTPVIVPTTQDVVLPVTNQPLQSLGLLTAFLVDGKTVNVNGNLFDVINSTKTVNGNLVSIINGGTLNINNAVLLNVVGTGMVSVSGPLAFFGGTGTNTLRINNDVCVSFCPQVGGIQVLLLNNANLSQITIKPGYKPFVGGTPTVNVTDAMLLLNGQSAQVKLGF
jgi:hypothetical protein